MRHFQHLTVIIRVAVRVNDSIAAQVIALENAAHFCWSRTITLTVPTGEPAVAFLELCADEFHANAAAPGTQARDSSGHATGWTQRRRAAGLPYEEYT
jgi:hypothetical protein